MVGSSPNLLLVIGKVGSMQIVLSLGHDIEMSLAVISEGAATRIQLVGEGPSRGRPGNGFVGCRSGMGRLTPPDFFAWCRGRGELG